jgi:hypothetical protein
VRQSRYRHCALALQQTATESPPWMWHSVSRVSEAVQSPRPLPMGSESAECRPDNFSIEAHSSPIDAFQTIVCVVTVPAAKSRCRFITVVTPASFLRRPRTFEILNWQLTNTP